MAYANGVAVTVTNNPGTAGDFIFSAAAPGAVRLPRAAEDGGVFTLFVQQGTSYEIVTSTYTHATLTFSRGILVDSSGTTVARVNFTAGAVVKVIGYTASELTLFSGAYSTGQFGKRVAILGDSMAAQSALYDEMWPVVLERNLRQNGVPCEVRSFSINAHTAYRSYTTASYGTTTALVALLGYQPDVVIVSFGFNDAWQKVDGRTSAEVNSDITSVLGALRAYLPNALIYFAEQYAYDKSNFTPATLKNKGAPPQVWNRSTAGILTNYYTPEFLETAVTSGVVTSATDYDSFITTATGSASINGYFSLNAWKVARLGLLTSDGLHFTRFGHVMLAGYAMKGLLAQTSFTTTFGINYSPQIVTDWIDPDSVFNALLVDSGDGYNNLSPSDTTTEVVITNQSYYRAVRPNEWFHPYKAVVRLRSVSDPTGGTVSLSSTSVTGMYMWDVKGAKPNTSILLSVDGAAFASTSETTDAAGDFTSVARMAPLATALGLGTGAHTFRFAVGSSAFGPFTLTLTA